LSSSSSHGTDSKTRDSSEESSFKIDFSDLDQQLTAIDKQKEVETQQQIEANNKLMREMRDVPDAPLLDQGQLSQTFHNLVVEQYEKSRQYHVMRDLNDRHALQKSREARRNYRKAKKAMQNKRTFIVDKAIQLNDKRAHKLAGKMKRTRGRNQAKSVY